MLDDVIDLDLDHIRQKLEQERARLMASLAPDEGENGRSRNPDRGDLAQRYSNRERDVALQAMEMEQLAQIEAALERMEAGTYGRCESCGQQIPAGRLEILPYATLCVNCQSQQERVYGAV
ncbi:MAG: TraR/DksA C4-type zinc finger protein [Ardenticatenaceae bacterium]|nr:TraR/DksA C4-type zinc finger protein [Ardenticatenaceae bacterium]